MGRRLERTGGIVWWLLFRLLLLLLFRMDAFEFASDVVEFGFEFGQANVKGGLRDGPGGLVDEVVDGDAGKFRQGAESGVEAELAKLLVLFRREADADHAIAGIELSV